MIIPFFIPHAGCPHRCVFCDQKSITGQSRAVDPSTIPRTINEHLRSMPAHERVQAAFYGGSFTALPVGTQTAYLEAVRPFIDSGMIESIRLSTRPDAVTPDILALLERHRVRTVELGVQSMNDQVLALSSRGHTAAGTVNAVTLLRDHGFDIGLQLMPGLPGDTATTFRETVTRVIALRPLFVRVYPAVVIRGTPLEDLYRGGSYRPLSLGEAVELCREAFERFDRSGIDVIRTGLQPTDALTAGDAIVAGPYHPAFGQLVASSRFLEKMRTALRAAPRHAGPVIVRVHDGDLSTAIGQKRTNVRALAREFGLRDIRILPDPQIPHGSVEVNFLQTEWPELWYPVYGE
ncbi:MAG TPA: radical SAM protein [Nitrospirota bacterium]|nr:radical SAM protein [Nitrospirota bacterium]